jgi:membrane protease YdiL (CAAX protease family)
VDFNFKIGVVNQMQTDYLSIFVFLKKYSKMTESTTKTYQENWLFVVFIVLFTLAIACFFILDTSELVNNSRSQEDVPLLVLVFAALIIAPVFEELAFRGAFVNNKVYAIVSLVLTTGFIALSYENYYAMGAFALFVIAFFVYKQTPSKALFKLVCISNALLFGLVHYKMEDFVSIERGFIVLFQISIGFALIWITLNFNLVRSMIAHGVYNALAMGIFIYSLQFPDTKLHRYEDENITVEWQNVPYFESLESSYSMMEDSIIAEGITLKLLYPSLTTTDSIKKEKMMIIDPYMKQNFRIILKENAAKSDIDLATETFLLEENFIMLDESTD